MSVDAVSVQRHNAETAITLQSLTEQLEVLKQQFAISQSKTQNYIEKKTREKSGHSNLIAARLLQTLKPQQHNLINKAAVTNALARVKTLQRIEVEKKTVIDLEEDVHIEEVREERKSPTQQADVHDEAINKLQKALNASILKKRDTVKQESFEAREEDKEFAVPPARKKIRKDKKSGNSFIEEEEGKNPEEAASSSDLRLKIAKDELIYSTLMHISDFLQHLNKETQIPALQNACKVLDEFPLPVELNTCVTLLSLEMWKNIATRTLDKYTIQPLIAASFDSLRVGAAPVSQGASITGSLMFETNKQTKTNDDTAPIQKKKGGRLRNVTPMAKSDEKKNHHQINTESGKAKKR